MPWPSPQDYAEAVQTPRDSFADSELQKGQVKLNALGLPVGISGAFATVFCIECQVKKVAVRCFLSNIKDQEERYAEISKFVLADDLPYTVGFDYLPRGIHVKGEWYPILKMEWVEGETLGEYLRKVKDPAFFGVLAGYFKQMILELKRAGIAHGDLQHDNIMFSDSDLRLVDYDGMFVPSLKGRSASELGHRNYQHPSRTPAFFDNGLDNFSAWTIFASLKCLSIDSSLWERLDCGNDCLLFRHSDYLSPQESRALATLHEHDDERIRRYAAVIHKLLTMPIGEIPSLDVPLFDTVELAPFTGTAKALPALVKLPVSAVQEVQRVVSNAPSKVEERTQLPVVFDPDLYYPQVSTITIWGGPAKNSTTEKITSKVQSQLLPQEKLHFISGLESHGYVAVLLATLVICALLVVFSGIGIGALVVGVFGYLLASYALSQGLFPLSNFFVSNVRIIVADIWHDSTVYSVPLEEVDSVIFSGGYVEIKAKSEFRTPRGAHHHMVFRMHSKEERKLITGALPKSVKVITDEIF